MKWLLLLLVSLHAVADTPAGRPQSALDRWRMSRVEVYLDDFGQLSRYRDANAGLSPPAPGEDRVVFLGDSITDSWNLGTYFPARPYINRGISGQTTTQMLVRFRRDVIDLKPRVVVILAGTNDIAGNTGPMQLEDIEANYASLAELAAANGIRVILASVLPVHNYTPAAADYFADRAPARIVALNRWMKSWCDAHGALYLDYFSAMVDAQGFMRRDLADDGLHPNAAGYRVMAPLLESAIRSVAGSAR